MSKVRQLLQFVILALLFNVGRTTRELAANDVVSVHVTNGLPEKSDVFKIECKFNGKSLGVRDLGVGEDYRWNVEEKVVYFCQAIWGLKFGSWHAFEPSRDANHDAVFWLAKSDGFFLSYDNATWVQEASWESE